ncbi:MAG TPA: aminopeptidase [Bacteroidota bacterium]|nr:aminopeptidase [Bacteroidota bacterium]
MPTDLLNIPLDPDLLPGAHNAIAVCLAVRPGERVTLITDAASEAIGASIYREILGAGASCSVFLLEDFGTRPHKTMPREILDELGRSQVSVYAAVGQPGELGTRMEMTRVVSERKIRHAHMININRRIMTEGMRADFRAVDSLSARVLDAVQGASRIRATTPLGTDITVDLSPSLRWVKTSGLISPDHWGNLPGGEIFTCPGAVEGTFVVDGVVGDYLCAKYGDLAAAPLTVEIRGSRLKSARSENRGLEREFWEYCHADGESDRVGEFAIGTNLAVDHVIGHILQDEKIPGVHIAFGNPAGEQTGANWTSGAHIDVVGTRFSIWADERQIMSDGKFVLS